MYIKIYLAFKIYKINYLLYRVLSFKEYFNQSREVTLNLNDYKRDYD